MHNTLITKCKKKITWNIFLYDFAFPLKKESSSLIFVIESKELVRQKKKIIVNTYRCKYLLVRKKFQMYTNGAAIKGNNS